jgi:hypothetical protein
LTDPLRTAERSVTLVAAAVFTIGWLNVEKVMSEDSAEP